MTPDEQQTLAKWSSWGAVPAVFDPAQDRLETARAEVKAALGGGDGPAWVAARRTTINAHYTDPNYARVMWDTLGRLGFDGGRVLEPGCGGGVFIGTAPDTADMIGVELDPTSAAITARLYPHATIRAESFAETRLPDGFFDAAIGNVPFADVTLHDPLYNAAKHSIHNHFIVKALAMTRPGGMVAVLTSHHTLDAKDPAARRDMHRYADLVGAIRLPSGAHAQTAGTAAVTDLLVFRRRGLDEPPRPADPAWLETRPTELDGPNDSRETLQINNYWVTHPDACLGSMSARIGMYGIVGLHVEPPDPAGIAPAMEAAAGRLTDHAMRTGLTMTARTDAPAGRAPVFATETDGHIAAHSDGQFTAVRDGLQQPLKVPTTQAAEVRALLHLRDLSRNLIAAEAASVDDSPQLDTDRAALRDAWTGYVTSYGPIGRFTTRPTGRLDEDGEPVMAHIIPAPVRLLRRDPYGMLVSALESFDAVTQTATPTGLLRTRQIQPRKEVLAAETPADALLVCLDQLGRVDPDRIAQLAGCSPGEAITALGDAIYQVPPTVTDAGELDPATIGAWETRAAYLSGDVRDKLDHAKAAARQDPTWQRNVAALTAVIPEDLGPGDISARIGTTWIPDTIYQQFYRETMRDHHGRVAWLGGTDWVVEAKRTVSLEATSEWGTQRFRGPDLFKAMLEMRPIEVSDTYTDGDRKRTVVNQVESEAARQKAEQLQTWFEEWLWEDPARSEVLVDRYNRLFNGVVLRDYTVEGQHLSLPGLAKNINPWPHQLAAVARVLNEPAVGLFHQVGAGKTAEMVIAAAELKRLGLVRKPAIVVPNHMLDQFAREWLQLYPQARLLAADSDDLAGTHRRAFIARAATSDWDGIIMTQTAFQSIPLGGKQIAQYTQIELQRHRDALERAKDLKLRETTVKRMEKDVLRVEEQLKARIDAKRDPGLTFEETGIDYLFYDELHMCKNLATPSRLPGAGITGSQRATDLHMKLHYLRTTNGSRVFTGATATPIANSVSEMHVMLRYLAPDDLAARGIDEFDAWAATFGEVVQGYELSPAGKYQLRSRFARARTAHHVPPGRGREDRPGPQPARPATSNPLRRNARPGRAHCPQDGRDGRVHEAARRPGRRHRRPGSRPHRRQHAEGQ